MLLPCRVQQVCLSFHFAVEQRARSFLHTFFGFNGTAGVWRRTAMEQAGGWNMDSTVRMHAAKQRSGYIHSSLEHSRCSLRLHGGLELLELHHLALSLTCTRTSKQQPHVSDLPAHAQPQSRLRHLMQTVSVHSL